MCRIVDPNTLAIGVGEARAEQSNGAASDARTAARDRQTTFHTAVFWSPVI
jgi:hypothetical protein